MAQKRSTNTSIHSTENTEEHDPTAALVRSLDALRRVANMAARHGFKLSAHYHYAAKARLSMTELRRAFLELRSKYPENQFSAIAKELEAVAGPLSEIENGLPLPPRELIALIEEVSRRIGSDLHVALQATPHGPNEPFIVSEILPPGVYRKVLDEANRCFAQNCPNACAAMLRRLVESLIIEAFEAHGVETKIKDTSGEYLELKALIGKATAETSLRLTRNTRNALPNLKFLGDLSVHARRNLVRNDDLKALHNDARAALEELASHLPGKP